MQINARNVNDAYLQGLAYLRANGQEENSRAGPVLVAPGPVLTCYTNPQERVLFDPRRDANPFFHLFEALWMLSGARDATWLDQFVKDFSARFAEPGGLQHGAYGYRWRHHFVGDQLADVVQLLRKNPSDRRVVLTMWDPVIDLAADKRDICCNTHAYLRVHNTGREVPTARGYTQDLLDITVCCRSNDAIWGAYGANAVHFSVLQEYLAEKLGVGVGCYYQFSTNFHVYRDVLDKVGAPSDFDPYTMGSIPIGTQPMVTDPEAFDEDLRHFMTWAGKRGVARGEFRNRWFEETAVPLYAANTLWKTGDRAGAYHLVTGHTAIAPDWRLAALQWMDRRLKKEESNP